MARSGFSFCYCPECKKWIPADSVHYFDGLVVCDWCLNQEQEKPPHNRFVYDPHCGKIQCIMCDSYETEYIKGTEPYKYKCRDCGEEFIL